MALEFRLPNLGENIEAGDIVKVLVAKGDRIEVHQPILELETDKAVIEVPSSVGGVVGKIHLKEGEKVEVGQLVLTLDGASEDRGSRPAAAESKAPRKKKKTARQPTAPPVEKRITEPTQPQSSAVAVGEKGEVVEFARAPKETDPAGERLVPAPPSVRRFARQIGVDISLVKGSGPRGRISTDDVKSHSRSLHQSQGLPASPVSAPPLPDFSQWGETERVAFSGVRRKTAQHMASSWNTIPHVTQCDKADITELEQARKRFGRRVEESGGKLTITAILLKVLASGLKAFPQFNASVDVQGEEIVFKRYCHIGVAVDTDRGLLVPVIRDVAQKNILTLSKDLSQAAEKARLAKLSLEEMQGGCFTVTNLGGIGGTYFSPIVNWPEVAILGVSRGRVEAVHREGEFVPRLMLPLSLSYDHRVIDGSDAIRFLRWVSQALEDPFLLALEG